MSNDKGVSAGFSVYITAKGLVEFLGQEVNQGGAELYGWTPVPDLAIKMSKKQAEASAKRYGKGAEICEIYEFSDRYEIDYL